MAAADRRALDRGERFRLGVNYWPARTAMGWWAHFDQDEVAADFARIAAAGFDSVRLFLTWEDFQPAPDRVDALMLRRLVLVADLAAAAGLDVVPTLFVGHMSGVNWIPRWALSPADSRSDSSSDGRSDSPSDGGAGGAGGDRRFRVVSGGRVSTVGSGGAVSLRNWYADASIARAQAALAGEAAAALAGHAALWMWDLGNEQSNCVLPPSRSSAQAWLQRMAAAIRAADASARITLGLHMEDLEQDRSLGPADAAEVCDVLSMHGYPLYARWAEGATDEQVLPFLAHVTRWLGGGLDLLFSEFGLPTYRAGDPREELAAREGAFPLIEERVAAAYTERALVALREAGCAGAMLWCYADYAPAIWDSPPLDEAVHERSFGLWRADGSPKPAVAAIEAFAGAARIAAPADPSWIDIEPHELRADPSTQLPRLYRQYRQYRQHRQSGDDGEASSR